jgi:hypothetical protein
MQLLRRASLSAVILFASAAAIAKDPAPQKITDDIKSSSVTVTEEFVQKAFGDSCKLLKGPMPWKGDFDGDGVEDIAIPARCKNPLEDQAEYGFKALDPYGDFYGYGNVKITSEFGSQDPDMKGISVLVIHGAGPEAWRSETPKAKYLLINLPYKSLSVKKMQMHKRKITAIYLEEQREGDGIVSAVYWDGKKYKYDPVGANFE